MFPSPLAGARLTGAALAALLLAAAPRPAEAGFAACVGTAGGIAWNIGTSHFVSTGTDCTISTAFTQDQPASRVNAHGGFFGVTDWDQLFKVETGGASGTYDFGTSLPDSAASLMLVFKSGSSNLVGYLVDPAQLAGRWTSMFVRPAFSLPGNSQVQDVSHVSFYWSPTSFTSSAAGQQDSVAVPAPAALALFGVGLLGLAAVRGRRARA